MKYDLRVHNILITGGSSGIGLAVASELVKEADCKVCICGRDLTRLERAASYINSTNVSILQMDIRDISSIDNKLIEADGLLNGKLDGVVNNAGIYVPHEEERPWNETEEEWDAVWDTNLKGSVFLMRRFVKYMRQTNRKGNVCCIGSGSSHYVFSHGSYPASKYVYERMVRSHAKQAASYGVVINGVNPGVTATPINPWAKDGMTYNNCSIKRIISAHEIAECVLFMMSKTAEICIGSMLDAEGGMNACF